MSGRAKKDPIFQSTIAYLSQRLAQLPDRRVGNNRFISMRDIGLSAFVTFFMQCPSFLHQQRLLKKHKGKSNVSRLFGIEHIPSDNHIRTLLDAVPPSELFSLYDVALNRLQSSGLLKQFRFLNNQLLIAVDGVQYYSSPAISCNQCSHKTHKHGGKTYSHSMVAATLVHPERREVIPLKPEFIVPQDGHAKQDCERTAIKRWLSMHGHRYGQWGATLLGDDLYACQPVCEQVLSVGCHFIFTCKPASHTCLYEWVEPFEADGNIHRCEARIRHKGKRYTYHCRYVNQVPLRDGKKALLVHWCGVEVLDAKGKKVYTGAFITDHELTDANVVEVAQAGRTRWKIENEHNNTLKNQGYYLSHNYGHGQQHLASLLTTLILLSFLLHSMLQLLDARYQAIRRDLPRSMFFSQIRTLMSYLHFASWDSLMELMMQELDLGYIDTG